MAKLVDKSEQNAEWKQGVEAELSELDRLIARERVATKVSASAQELKLLLWATMAFMLPITFVYLIHAQERRVIALYSAIVATVLAAWGIYRSARSQNAKPRGIGVIFGIMFAMILLFYGTMALGIYGVFVVDVPTTTIKPMPVPHTQFPRPDSPALSPKE